MFGTGTSSRACVRPTVLTDRPDDPSSSEVDPATVRRRLRRRAEEIKRDELERALSKLEARGTVTETEREIVSTLAAEIVDGVVDPPEAAITEVSRSERGSTAAVVRLFDLDDE